MFGIGVCEWSSIFWAQRRGKREQQMKGYVAEQKVSEVAIARFSCYNKLFNIGPLD